MTLESVPPVPEREPAVAHWATTIPLESLWVCALTIAEIERGVLAKERVDPQQGAVLRQWFERSAWRPTRRGGGRFAPSEVQISHLWRARGAPV